MGMWKKFFEIYRQFGHAPSKSFTSPAIDYWTWKNKVLHFFKNIKTTSPMIQHYIPEGQIFQHWMMFMNILTFISDGSYCLCLIHSAEADTQHVKKHTIRNEQCDSSQFTVSLLTEENNWHSLRPHNWTWILVHTHSLNTDTLT